MPRRKGTCNTFSVRSTVTKPNRRSSSIFAAALIALACAPAAGASTAGLPPIETILAAYDRAMHGSDVATVETIGTITGGGLSGTFHTWRDGDRERDDESLGPRSETTLRIGDRIWVRNSNRNVHELTGVLRRRELTNEFVDSGAFVKAPERSRVIGFGTIDGRRTWNIEVSAAGGDPETLWIDVENGRPLRTEYLDGDGPTDIDLSDWRLVGGMQMAFRSITSDGEHAFDTIAQTTSITFGKAVDPAVFVALEGDRLIADGVQTVPLIDDGARISCSVTIAGKAYTFLIDSGSGNVLLDSQLAKNAGLLEEGALEVRGATRSGGMHVALLPRLSIGGAALDNLVISTLDLGANAGRMHLDGILGYPFFATSEVQLDFAQHVMRFGPPGSFAAPGDRIALDTDREIPEAVFRIDGRIDAPFIVDTGDTANLLLYAPFVAQHPGLAPASGGASSFIGVGGVDRSYATLIDAFTLGSTTLVAQTADVIEAGEGAFADRVDAGNVGLEMLRNFTVTFDFTNHVLVLERARRAAGAAAL